MVAPFYQPPLLNLDPFNSHKNPSSERQVVTEPDLHQKTESFGLVKAVTTDSRNMDNLEPYSAPKSSSFYAKSSSTAMINSSIVPNSQIKSAKNGQGGNFSNAKMTQSRLKSSGTLKSNAAKTA